MKGVQSQEHLTLLLMTHVEAGKTFYYLLEEIQNDGKANQYEDDKFSYTVPGMTGLSVMLAALAIVVGLGLIVLGIRETKS